MDEWATECAVKKDTCVVLVYFDVTDAAAVKNALMTIFKWEERIGLGRLGTPEGVANACAFLVSDKASYILGKSLE